MRPCRPPGRNERTWTFRLQFGWWKVSQIPQQIQAKVHAASVVRATVDEPFKEGTHGRIADEVALPSTQSESPERQALIDVSVESWKFARLFARVMSRLEAGDQSRYEGQLRWHLKKLEDHLAVADLRLVNIEGQVFDPGIAATALNGGDFGAEDILYVDQMLEPIIMSSAGLVRGGTVLLRKLEK